jgi:hypothetical protein
MVADHSGRFAFQPVFVTLLVWRSRVQASSASPLILTTDFFEFVGTFWLVSGKLAWFSILGINRRSLLGKILKRLPPDASTATILFYRCNSNAIAGFVGLASVRFLSVHHFTRFVFLHQFE